MVRRFALGGTLDLFVLKTTGSIRQ